MAVPADIRAVKRPVNTIVDDSGRDGPKRYAVRERSGAKYVQGGNPQPRNGKVIGHIIGHIYVPLEEKAPPIAPDMLSYGASALVKSVTSDLFHDLLAVYPAGEAYSIMSMATLKVIKPSVTAMRMSSTITGHLSAWIIPVPPSQRTLSAVFFSGSDRMVPRGRCSTSAVLHK